MKRTIFTLVRELISYISFPQDYHKLIQTNTSWDEYMVFMPEKWCYTSAKRIFFTNMK
jgi:hypothetical protein